MESARVNTSIWTLTWKDVREQSARVPSGISRGEFDYLPILSAYCLPRQFVIRARGLHRNQTDGTARQRELSRSAYTGLFLFAWTQSFNRSTNGALHTDFYRHFSTAHNVLNGNSRAVPHGHEQKKTTISFKRDVASRCGLSVSNLKCTKAHKFTTPFFVVQSAIFLIKFVIDLQVYNSTSSIDCIRCKSQFVLVSQCTTARSFSNYIFLSGSSEFLKK